MTTDLLAGWVKAERLDNQCGDCRFVTFADPQDFNSSTLVSCGYGQPWFPHANKCRHYESESAA